MQQATLMIENALLRIHDNYRKRTNTVNIEFTKWPIHCDMREKQTDDPMNQTVLDLFNYFKEKCFNNFGKIPFFKGSILTSPFKLNKKKPTIMRDVIIDKDTWSMDFVTNYFSDFLKFATEITQIVEGNFDSSEKLLTNDGNSICFQFIQFVEKYLTSMEIPFQKDGQLFDNHGSAMSQNCFKPYLFCHKLSLMVVNLDERKNKEAYLRYTLITQNIVTMKNNGLCISYIISGNSISVFAGSLADHLLIFDLHRTFNLENVDDLLDLALEFFRYFGYVTGKMLDLEYYLLGYEKKKIDGRAYFTKLAKIEKKKKQNEMIEKVRKNLTRLEIQ